MTDYKHIMHNAGLTANLHNNSTLFTADPINLCPMCLGPKSVDYFYCTSCYGIVKGPYQNLLPDSISFLVYAGATKQSRADFYNYKSTPTGVPNPGFLRIQSVVKDFTNYHHGCMSNNAGMAVDVIGFVPSGKTERYNVPSFIPPLLGFSEAANILQRNVPRTNKRDNGIDPTRYTVLAPVRDLHVLLFEDTWVSGTNSISSAVALKNAGARYVSLVVLGRYLDPAHYHFHKIWLDNNQIMPFDPIYCPVSRSYRCPPPLAIAELNSS